MKKTLIALDWKQCRTEECELFKKCQMMYHHVSFISLGSINPSSNMQGISSDGIFGAVQAQINWYMFKMAISFLFYNNFCLFTNNSSGILGLGIILSIRSKNEYFLIKYTNYIFIFQNRLYYKHIINCILTIGYCSAIIVKLHKVRDGFRYANFKNSLEHFF